MTGGVHIIGWGNRGRRDDGAAHALLERLRRRICDDTAVSFAEYHQLGPETAEDLAGCRLVVFLDAHVVPDGAAVMATPIGPAATGTLGAHHCSPQELLALAAVLGHNVPEAWLVTVRSHDLNFGDTLTPATAAAVEAAERIVVDRVADTRSTLAGQ